MSKDRKKGERPAPAEPRTQLYLRGDIADALAAIDTAAAIAAILPGPEAAAFRVGFSNGLQAVATAFGIDWQDIQPTALPARTLREAVLYLQGAGR